MDSRSSIDEGKKCCMLSHKIERRGWRDSCNELSNSITPITRLGFSVEVAFGCRPELKSVIANCCRFIAIAAVAAANERNHKQPRVATV
ncbi:unnamed protein product [Urochloa humidicola]